MSYVARTTLWGTVQTGPGFARLPEAEQEAVMMHEIGHIDGWHALKRLWWVLTLRALLRPYAYFAMCEQQELDADQYAAACGCASGLRAFVQRLPAHKTLGYPTKHERLARLQ